MITLLHGGQTGVDRGGHDAAIANGWSIAGYMTRDRRDELGQIPLQVAKHLVPIDSPSYAARTAANVRAATAALIIVENESEPGVTPGTAKTIDLVIERRLRRKIIDPRTDASAIARWIWDDLLVMRVMTLPFVTMSPDPIPTRLLVAGPRESKWRGAHAETAALLRRIGASLAEIGRATTTNHP